MNLVEYCTGIADAIREKEGSTELIPAPDHANRIRALEIGGGTGGGGEGEWSGDGNTHIWVSLPERRTSPRLFLAVKGTVTLDWGDGSAPDVLSGTNLNSKYTNAHEYDKAGDYVITLSGEGQVGFGGSSSDSLVSDGTAISTANATYRCSVKRIEVGNNAVKIGSYSFSSMPSLKEVKLPHGVTSIGTNAFENDYSLTNVNVDNVAEFGNYAFNQCMSLKAITLCEGASFGQMAFNNCASLTKVVIPVGVTFNSYVFNNCGGVKCYDFTQHTGVPALPTTNVFQNSSSDCEFRVPAALVDTWKAATNWSTYADKIVGV